MTYSSPPSTFVDSVSIDSRFVGVDGCPYGWIAVARVDGRLAYRLFAGIDALLAACTQASRVLIDIPIGLPWVGCPVRPCEPMARQRLGARRSSVFPVPCRAAAHATDVRSARTLNVEQLGRSLSAQAWNICRKIAEVDRLLTREPAWALRLEEMHPELCFAGLGDGQPMRHPKKTRAGIDERLAVLARYEPRIEAFVADVLAAERKARVAGDRRPRVAIDDVLDAAIGQVAARAPPHAIGRLAGEPGRDECGLPMRIAFASAWR